MSISLTQVITNLQADIDAVDSDTSMDQILKYMHRARSLTEINSVYDSVGVMPTDSAYDGMLAFSKSDNTMYKFVDSSIDGGTIFAWHQADSAFSSGGGGLAPIPAVDMRGTSFGYHMSGTVANMNKYSFASDGNATDLGNYSVAVGPITDATVESGTPGQSATAGYIFNMYGDGYSPGVSPASWTRKDAVKYPYATDAVSQTTATMLTAPPGRALYRGVRDAVGNRTYAYQIGGQDYATSPSSASWVNIIGKFATATDANATDVGDLAAVMGQQQGNSSSTHGYVSGGYNQGATQAIQKVDFSSDGNATSVGNLSPPARTIREGSGGQSDTDGYVFGGFTPPSPTVPSRFQEVQKYPFASDTSATNLGNQLTTGRYQHSGSSSSVSIYSSGGKVGSWGALTSSDNIEKFDVASDTGGTDVGDLNAGGQNATGSGI